MLRTTILELKCERASEWAGRLVKADAKAHSLRLWFIKPAQGLRMCIANIFPGDTAAASLWTMPWESLFNSMVVLFNYDNSDF